MCGRYSLASSGQLELGSRFGLREEFVAAPRFNICPGEAILAIRPREDGREPVWRSWGLVPHWAKEPSIGSRMINARSETAPSKPAFAPGLEHARILIPADGFYEWAPARTGRRRPFHITVDGGRLFAFAGIEASWRPPDGGEPIRTCTILTRAAGPELEGIHDREPVILDGEQAERRWLDRESSREEVVSLMAQRPDGIVARPVGYAVSDAGFDGPECLDDAPPDPQGTLFGTV